MTREEVKNIIEEEKKLYISEQYRMMKWTHQKRYLIWKTLASFRMARFWKSELNNQANGALRRLHAKIAYRWFHRQRNLYSEKSGVEIASHSVLGRRLNIWHGGVVISGHLGDDCVLHGNNIIGNKGVKDGNTPALGDRVDVGVGAVVIGGICVADDCTIGANAVVNKNFTESGSLIVGIPAYVKGKG